MNPAMIMQLMNASQNAGSQLGSLYNSQQNADEQMEKNQRAVDMNAANALQSMQHKFLQIKYNADLQYDQGTRMLVENALTAMSNRATARAAAAEAGAEGASLNALLNSIAGKEGRFAGYVEENRRQINRGVELSQNNAWLEAVTNIRSFTTPDVKSNTDFGNIMNGLSTLTNAGSTALNSTTNSTT